jgi:hypothetical protein
MSLSQTLTTSFKQQLLQGVHDFDTDTFKVALYTASADLNDTTTAYNVATAGQVANTGNYSAGGATTATSVSVTGTVAFVNFGNVSWTAALTARGALIYNSSKSDKAVAILDFGADKTSVTTFTVTMPANTSTTALIRLP